MSTGEKRPENLGGSGGGDNQLKRSEMLVLRRALKKESHILVPVEFDSEVPVEMTLLAMGATKSASKRIAAARLVLDMKRFNLEIEKLDAGAQEVNVNVSGEVKHEHSVAERAEPYRGVVAMLAAHGSGLADVRRNGAMQSVDSPQANGETGLLPPDESDT